MAPKDESEMTIVKKASQATIDLFKKYLREQIMDLIDRDKVGHITLAHTARFVLFAVIKL